MLKKFLIIAASWFLLCLNSLAAQPQLFKLNNGHTVVIKEIPQSEIVTVDTWVKTGSLNENDKNNGVSHFLEHLMFKGTKNHKAGEFEKILDNKGAIYNAATSKDFTHYYITSSKDNLKETMDLHFDMLLNPLFPQEEIDKERKVVIEEISRSNDNPTRALYKNFTSMMYKQHPYRYETIGTKEIISTIPRDEIVGYYNKFYTPNNFTTVIAGNVNSKNVLDIINEEFKNKQFQSTKPIQHKKEIPQNKPQEKITYGNYNTGYLMLGYHGVDFQNQKENLALDIAGIVLGDGRSSRLYQNIKEKQHLANSISSSHSSSKDDSIFYISANFKPQNYEKLKKAVLCEIEKLRTTNITDEELQKAINMVERDFIYSNESTDDIASSIGYIMTIGGKLEYYTNYVNELKKITPDDVRKAACKYLDPNKVVISVLMPDKNEKPAANITPCEQKVCKKILSNGAVFISENSDANEVISMSILFKGGKWVESKPGLTPLLASTMMKGTKNRSSLELAQEMENYGIIIAPSVNNDYLEISVKSTTKDFDRTMSILEDVLNNASFDINEIEKTKKDMLEQIKKAEDFPKTKLFDNLISNIFPQGPYSQTGDILKKSIPAITKADIENYYQTIFIPQNMIISVTGNLKNTDICSKLENLISRKSGKIVDNKKFITPYKPLPQNKIVKYAMENNQANWIALGYKTGGISDFNEYTTLKVISSILGSGMSSRLFVDLREKKGLAYEVSSYYPTLLDNSYFVMYIGTNPKNSEEATKEFFKQIERLKNEPLSEQELANIKSNMKGLLALMQETNAQRSELRARFELLRGDYDFINNYSKTIDKVTSGDIMRVARKYFSHPYVLSEIETKK